MPFYRLIRHVVYSPRYQESQEVWGIDRPAPGLRIASAPRSTDADDPLRKGPCSPLLLLRDGEYVTWHRFMEWASEVEADGYEIMGGMQKLSPYTPIVIRGP